MSGWGDPVIPIGGGAGGEVTPIGNTQVPGDTALSDPQKFKYDEVTSVPKNVETTIINFVIPPNPIIHLMSISCGGTCVARYNVYYNSEKVDQKIVWYGQGLETSFDYRRGPGGGIAVSYGNIVYVKVLVTHPRMTTNDFYCRINYLEVN